MSMISTTDMSYVALGTPRAVTTHLFAGVVSVAGVSAFSAAEATNVVSPQAATAGVANADGARKWGRPPRGTPR